MTEALTKEQLQAYARRGMTARDIGEAVGRSEDTIRRRAKLLEVTLPRPVVRKFTDAELVALVDEGLFQREIAESLGVSQSTVSSRIDSLGLRKRLAKCTERRSRPPPPSPLKSLTREQKRDVKTLVRSGLYSQEEAIRKVTRPKVKVRAFPKEARV